MVDAKQPANGDRTKKAYAAAKAGVPNVAAEVAASGNKMFAKVR